MQPLTKIKGFADLFEPESLVFRHLEETARAVFARHGFQELRTPILERTELFQRSIGEETDVVQKEMYTFPDRKDRSLTLRPEATAGVMRAFIESGLHTREPVSRLFTIGPMFRYERPQKGRMRQFHQINVECLGLDAPWVDAEIITMLWRFLQALELPTLSLEVNSLGCPDCRPAYMQALRDFLANTPDADLCEDCARRRHKNPLRLLDCKSTGCKAVMEHAPKIADHGCPACREHFATVLELLRGVGIAPVVNHRLVRGLDYYTRTTFEVVSGDIGAQAAVAGGGRYDGLIKQLGGPDLPGIGFACGMERLALLAKAPAKARPAFCLILPDASALPRAFELASTLRDAGLPGDMGEPGKSFKSQMRAANRIAARFALILGPDELAQGLVQCKNLDDGTQTPLSLDDIPALARHLTA
ncbi:histidine--tRNA ligase [Megalodesulfovibrio paquesii]